MNNFKRFLFFFSDKVEITPQNIIVGVAVLIVSKPILQGLGHTFTFIGSLTGRKQARYIAQILIFLFSLRNINT
jgi:hypothetical protein